MQGLALFVFFWIGLISTGASQEPDVREFCTSVFLNPPSRCNAAQCQGREGKRGLQGRPGIVGPKGQKGDRGSGTQDLERKLIDLEDKLREKERTAALDYCALGMKSHKIPDSAITASSASSALSGSRWARLDQQPTETISSGSWCPASGDRSKWIKINLGRLEWISGVVTQGSPSSNYWTKTYTMACGDDYERLEDVTEFGARKVFKGNSDRNTKSVNFFAKKMKCRSLVIRPRSWNRGSCMRLEILRGACNNQREYEIYVESAGYQDGNTCKVLINGVDHARRSRGHCVVILDPVTGEISARTFDTHTSQTETNAMVNFLKAARNYSIISIAVMDSGEGKYITEEASILLQNLGAVGTDCNTRTVLRDSWAFITQKIPSGVSRPFWVKCQHVLRLGGKATVHAIVPISAHYESLDDSPIG